MIIRRVGNLLPTKNTNTSVLSDLVGNELPTLRGSNELF